MKHRIKKLIASLQLAESVEEHEACLTELRKIKEETHEIFGLIPLIRDKLHPADRFLLKYIQGLRARAEKYQPSAGVEENKTQAIMLLDSACELCDKMKNFLKSLG